MWPEKVIQILKMTAKSNVWVVVLDKNNLKLMENT